MTSFLAFIKKDIKDQLRSGRLMITLCLFLLFGIMNPAIAKLTPWLLEVMSDSLAESGMTITDVEISALDSWMQFFKNIPMALIALVLLNSSILTKEYSSGTLLLSLTKGLKRYKVVISKFTVVFISWTVGFWLCFGVTYLYNQYFFDNSVAANLLPSMVFYWLFGVMTVSLVTLSSVICDSSTGVLMTTGGFVLLCYLLGIIPKAGKYLPTQLTDGNSLIYGVSQAWDYLPSVIVTSILCVLFFAVSIPLFNRKKL